MTGLTGFLAVAFGAFAAHAVADPNSRSLLQTGAGYGLAHAAAALALLHRRPIVAAALTTGALIFGLSLYALALGAPRSLGLIAPLGGTLMAMSWLGLVATALRDSRKA